MKGTLYLNYWSNLVGNEIQYTFAICNGSIRPSISRLGGLIPSWGIIVKFKNDHDWTNYTKAYLQQITSTKCAGNNLILIQKILDSGNDVMLVCYESKAPCHRFIIGELFLRKGYKVISLDGYNKCHEYKLLEYKAKKE